MASHEWKNSAAIRRKKKFSVCLKEHHGDKKVNYKKGGKTSSAKANETTKNEYLTGNNLPQ